MTPRQNCSFPTSVSQPAWPRIPSEVESSVLKLLLPFLEQLGSERVRPSHRRRHNQRKRRKTVAHTSEEQHSPDTGVQKTRQITIGYNSTVRQLEHAVHGAAFLPLQSVLVCFELLPSALMYSLIMLATLASRQRPEHSVFLVPLHGETVNRLAQGLKQPRLSVLGLGRSLQDFGELQTIITEQLSPVCVPWLRQFGFSQSARRADIEFKKKYGSSSDKGDENDMPLDEPVAYSGL